MGIVALLILLSVLGLLPTLFVKKILDEALPQKNMGLLWLFVGLSFLTMMLKDLLTVLQNYLSTVVSKSIVMKMKNEMFQHLSHMPLSFFGKVKPGEIMTRITSDIDGVQSIFSSTLVQLTSSILLMVTTSAVLLRMDYRLTLMSLLMLPAFILPTRKVGKFRFLLAKEAQMNKENQNELIQESFSISGITLMKIFGKEDKTNTKFQKVNEESMKLEIRESLAGRWFFLVMNLFTSMGPLLIYLYGGYLFIAGELTIGAIVTFVALLGRLYGPVTQLSNLHTDVTRSMALFTRIFEYLDLPEEDKISGEEGFSLSEGKDLEFRNVSFSYDKTMETLKNISFSAKEGTMTALVGGSGAGKTTVTTLIPRLHEIDSGKITIGEQDIQEMPLTALRNKIGIVMQEPYLFHDTILENLRYGCEDASMEEVVSAAKAAYIHDFIESLPEGYQTVVGNRGIRLSGGEKQRISIARVLLKNPEIIILDEATSSLDSLSEEYIRRALVPLLKGRTSIVIAHRLSTILKADNILVMDCGEIKESGTHGELIQKDGLYRKLYDTQFREELSTAV